MRRSIFLHKVRKDDFCILLFLCGVEGEKHFTLFSPSEFKNLYPFPVHHANDRQCQVDIYDPDLNKFPNIVNAKGVEGIVRAGDVLFIPPYWFHHVISRTDSISINFWCFLSFCFSYFSFLGLL